MRRQKPVTDNHSGQTEWNREPRQSVIFIQRPASQLARSRAEPPPAATRKHGWLCVKAAVFAIETHIDAEDCLVAGERGNASVLEGNPQRLCPPWPPSNPQPRIGAGQLRLSGEQGRGGRLVSGISLTCLEVTCRCPLGMSFNAASQRMMTVITTDREYQMKGLMMRQPLLVSTLLTHAERHHGEREIVSKRVEGDIHRYRYRDLAQRARRMANALAGYNLCVINRHSICPGNEQSGE